MRETTTGAPSKWPMRAGVKRNQSSSPIEGWDGGVQMILQVAANAGQVVKRPQAHGFHHCLGPLPALGSRQACVDQQRLLQRIANAVAGIEGAIGVLENDLDVLADGARQLRRGVPSGLLEQMVGRQELFLGLPPFGLRAQFLEVCRI